MIDAFSGGDLSTSVSSASGDARGRAGSGNRTFNFGANPNTGLAGKPLSNPVLIVGGLLSVAAIIYAVTRKK